MTNLQQLENDLLVDLVFKYKVIESKAIDVVSVRDRTDQMEEALYLGQIQVLVRSFLFLRRLLHILCIT